MCAGVAPPLFVMQRKGFACSSGEFGSARVWARGRDDGGGAPSPSTLKGEWKLGLKVCLLKGMEGNVCFTVQPFARPGDALTGASLGLGGGLQFL